MSIHSASDIFKCATSLILRKKFLSAQAIMMLFCIPYWVLKGLTLYEFHADTTNFGISQIIIRLLPDFCMQVVPYVLLHLSFPKFLLWGVFYTIFLTIFAAMLSVLTYHTLNNKPISLRTSYGVVLSHWRSLTGIYLISVLASITSQCLFLSQILLPMKSSHNPTDFLYNPFCIVPILQTWLFSPLVYLSIPLIIFGKKTTIQALTTALKLYSNKLKTTANLLVLYLAVGIASVVIFVVVIAGFDAMSLSSSMSEIASLFVLALLLIPDLWYITLLMITPTIFYANYNKLETK